MMKKLQTRVISVNVLGVIGYLLMLFTWLLFVVVLVTLLTERSVVVPLQQVTDVSPSEPVASVLSTGVAYLITAAMAIVSFIVLIILPYLLGKWSSRGLRWLLKLLKITPTKRHMFLAKSIVVTLPLVGFFVVNLFLVSPTMTFSLLYVAAVISAALALVFFFGQLILARSFKIPNDAMW